MLERPVTREHPADVPEERPPSAMVPDESASTTTGHPSGLTIIASKIAPVSAGRSVMHRPRLVDWFEQQRRARLILVSAEAGYGKSTLLTDYAQRSSTMCVWYRIETSDGDWITFLSYMVATLREVDPVFGRATEALLRHVAAMGSSREVVLAQFLADLGTLDGSGLDVILDDYHLVEGSDDVRMVVTRLLERAPEGMRFIVAGRGRPNLALGRMLSQARVAELTIDDLRFTRAEIDELFSTTFQQPLGADDCEVIADRTEGWAASLRLVSASIAVSRPSEVGAFIKALSGATGPIYEFLADEVLTRLSDQNQRVLVHASLIDHVRPDLVSAALSVTNEPPSTEVVRDALGQAEALGLLGDRDGSGANRIHPLFRQFLAHHLEIAATPAALRSMHVAIAAAAEPSDWLVAAKHYALGAEPDDAMRVLGSAASEALGTGAWGAAVEIIDLMPDTTAPPSVEVIRARALVSEGRTTEALERLAELHNLQLNGDELALVSLAKASALHTGGKSPELWDEVVTLRSLAHSQPVVNRLAEAWALMGVACKGGSIGEARAALNRLAKDSSALGLDHFEGIALHNAATAAVAQGDYREAGRLAIAARIALGNSPPDASVRPSTLMIQAIAEAECGDFRAAQSLADEAARADDAHPDVLADGAYLATISGASDRARLLESQLRRLMADGPTEVGTPFIASVTRVMNQLADGDFAGAAAHAQHLGSEGYDYLDGLARSSYLRALTAVLACEPQANDYVSTALSDVEKQQAWRWEYRVRLLHACVAEDGPALRQWLEEAARMSRLAILELADLVGASLHLLSGQIPLAVSQSIAHYPHRWRPILLRQLDWPNRGSALVAARLLAEYGTQEDAPRIAEYERRASPPGRKPNLSRALVRRVSPTLRIHDLGRTTYEVSGIEGKSTGARRKALSLLMYLVTRPRQTATREQVMEELWPTLSPASATNSLHQTLHFVRRDIAPWTDAGSTAEYIPLDGDLIYLDLELVHIDSVAFVRLAGDALAGRDVARTGPSITRLYLGRFAPEFEYEDWAEDWRTLVHGQYLRLAQATASALQVRGDAQSAIEVLSRAIEIDPLAFDLRVALIRSLAQVGAADAAEDHYRHYATLMRRELEERAPPLDVVLRGLQSATGESG